VAERTTGGELRGFEARPLTRSSAAAQIAGQLRAAITDGSWPPGQRLPTEVELAATYGVSRGTVREAMRLLSAANLVATTRGAAGGSFVAVPEPEAIAEQLGDAIALWFRAGSVSLADVDHARDVVERECVRLAALHRTGTDLDSMRQAVEDGRDPDVDEWLAADLDFHIAISRAARNPILELAMTAIHMVRPRTNSLLIEALDPAAIHAQHLAIYEAIAKQNSAEAVAAFDAHFQHLSNVQARALLGLEPAELSVASIPDEDHPSQDVLVRRAALLETSVGPEDFRTAAMRRESL